MKYCLTSLTVTLLIHLYFLGFSTLSTSEDQKEKEPTKSKIKIIFKTDRMLFPLKNTKSKSSSNISFSKLFKTFNKLTEQVLNDAHSSKVDFDSSSNGIQLANWLFNRINYDDRIFNCNQQGLVKAMIRFNKDGFFDVKNSILKSAFPMLIKHTTKQLMRLRLPHFAKGPLRMNVLMDFIRTPAATYSQQFTRGDFYYMQILSNDVNKGHGNRLDTKDCDKSD